MPAMGRRDFNISTSLTGDLGQAFLQALNPQQHQIMMDILERQRRPLSEIVSVRRAIPSELRRFLTWMSPVATRWLLSAGVTENWTASLPASMQLLLPA